MTSYNTSYKFKKAFTLIELLIVIAIIGILMGLLFPAVGAAVNTARKAQARNDASQIVTACTAYETEYGRGPWGTNNFTQVDGALLQTLMGDNPRQIIFLEVQDTKGRRKNGLFDGAFLDPWGAPYQIAYDKNYSSAVTTAGTNRSESVRKNYAVWTDPDLQIWHTHFSASQRYVESW